MRAEVRMEEVGEEQEVVGVEEGMQGLILLPEMTGGATAAEEVR